jgi:hypothetical protein
MNRFMISAALGLSVLLLAPSAGWAQGSYATPDGKPPPKGAPARKVVPGPGKPNYAAPGPGPGRPDYRRGGGPGPRHVGPPGGYRPYYRPWSHRPHYGRIIGGVALGTIIGVTVLGLIPPRPDPDLCWYWADPYRSRGYWDYCD